MDRNRLVPLALIAFGSLHVRAADDISFGAIRWDAWNGRTVDVISSTVKKVMAPDKYHWRLPWFAKITRDVNGSADISVDEDDQAVMDQEIQYAHGAGLKYWAYDTYCVYPNDSSLPQCADYWGGSDPTSVGYKPADPAYGLRRHLASKYTDLMDFTLLLLGGSPATPYMRPRYLELFKSKHYHRVLNGTRPLVFLFQASEREANMNGGWDAWRKQWEAFRNESIAQGTGNPYFVVMSLNYEMAKELQTNLGFDALSAYALPGGTLDGIPFSKQSDKATSFWASAKSAKTPVVPPVPTGWDPRPRADHPPVWVHESGSHYIAPTAEEITNLFRNASDFIRDNPEVAEARVAISYAWNENTEGGWLLPTLGNGTMRLDAVKKALLG